MFISVLRTVLYVIKTVHLLTSSEMYVGNLLIQLVKKNLLYYFQWLLCKSYYVKRVCMCIGKIFVVLKGIRACKFEERDRL